MGKFAGCMVWVIAISILLSTILSCAIFTLGNPFTEVTLDLQDESPQVDVSPGSSGIVTATGTVTCKKWGPDQVKVSLTGNSTCGGASVIPPNMVFGGSGGSEEVRSFAVTARVPQGTSCSETPIITVNGIYVQGGMQYNIEPVSIEIIVLQYYRVDVFFNEGRTRSANFTVKSGESIDLDFIIHNAGNGNDRFEAEFVDPEKWEKEGFVLPDPIITAIPEKRNESVSWIIKTPDEETGIYILTLSTSSKGAEESQDEIKYISSVYLRLKEHTITDRIGDILLSPLAIFLLIVVLIMVIVGWYKKRG